MNVSVRDREGKIEMEKRSVVTCKHTAYCKCVLVRADKTMGHWGGWKPGGGGEEDRRT